MGTRRYEQLKATGSRNQTQNASRAPGRIFHVEVILQIYS